jgi:NDP-sugar pyrophosphorylase family protein
VTPLFYFVGIDKARFKKTVAAGDQLHLHVSIQRQFRNIWKFKAEARVDGEIVADAELMCAKSNLVKTPGMSTAMIHQSAIIHAGAQLGANVSVGALSIIGEHVEIGDNT